MARASRAASGALAGFFLAAILPCAYGTLRSGVSARLPTPEAMAQVQAEAALLQGFRPAEGGPPDAPHAALSLLAGTAGTPGSAGTCDVAASGPICSSAQRRTVTPPSVAQGLVGHWTFDGPTALDASGNGNHGATELLHGPAPSGLGHSALFRRNFLTVPNSVQFQARDFSYSFWIYFLEDASTNTASKSPKFCPMIRKGISEVATRQFASFPAILHSRSSGRLRVSLTTSAGSVEDGEFIDSNARLTTNRWVHITVVHQSGVKKLSLYVNGILDATATTHGEAVPNEFPLYVGGDPFTVDQCEHPVYIDELRVYNRAILPHELDAEAAPALSGMGSSFARLGCIGCTLQTAVASCPRTHHVCTSLELHTGGYQVARAQGWVGVGTHIWTHAAVAGAAAAEQRGNGLPSAASTEYGLGMCCRGTL